MTNPNIQKVADELINDGMMGDFIRGELGAVACDNPKEWVSITTEVIRQLTKCIDTCMTNHFTEDN